MQHRLNIALWLLIALAFLASVIAAIQISLLDSESHANSRPPQLRPTRDVGEFEIMMSRHRRVPYAPTVSAVVLMTFLISTQLLLLRFVTKPNVRWLGYSTATLIGIAWTWYQITPWLDSGECSVLAKIIGEPLYYVLIPLVFFACQAKSHAPWPPLKTIIFVFSQLIAHLAWFYPWAFIQLFLGWYWI